MRWPWHKCGPPPEPAFCAPLWGRGLIESFDAKEMLGYQHSGFSVNPGVCIQPHDHAGLERLLRYCARPPFAMERLRQRGANLVYHCPKPQTGGKQTDLVLTPLELIDRIAALVPPPRTHRHRYFGVLAPNSSLRSAVTAMVQAAPVHAQSPVAPEQPEQGAAAGTAAGAVQPPAIEPARRSPAHYLWAVLIARIYEVFPLVCPICAGQMRLIAFITDGAEVRKVLEHIEVDCLAPRITPARGPPLWDDCDAPVGHDADAVPEWDLGVRAAPDYDIDQRTSHKLVNSKAAMKTRLGVCLRSWQVVQPKPWGAAGFIGRRLAKPGITACNVRVMTLIEGAILGLRRLKFLSVFVDALPKSTTGKLQWRELQEREK